MVVGTSNPNMEKPIIGPPEIIFSGCSLNPPAASKSSWKLVPIKNSKLPGSSTASPVTVKILLVTGFPSFTAPPHTPAGGYGIRPYAQTKPPCRGRACPARNLAITTPFILCIVGRGLDRLTAHNERRQPAKLARSCGCLPCRGKHCSLPSFAPLNRGPTLTTPHLRGASGTPPPTTQSAGLLITANVRGGLGAGRPTSHFTTFHGAGLRPQLIHATP